MKRGLVGLGTLLVSTLLLTGCTPPMPPEVRAALAEANYTCETGAVPVNFPAAIATLADSYAESLNAACAELSITPGASGGIEFVTDPEQISAGATAVPFALDAAVVAFNIPGLTALDLSPKTLAGVLGGTIADWADPLIAADNPGLAQPSLPITVERVSTPVAVAALTDWLDRLGAGRLPTADFDLRPAVTAEDYLALPEGAVAVLPYSTNMDALWPTIGLRTGSSAGAADSGQGAVVPAGDSIGSAASQLVAEAQGAARDRLTVALDPKLKPAPPAGQDVAVEPYQALTVVWLVLPAEATLPQRAVARFLLRQDSQGMLASSNLLPLPESVRISALELASRGLPEPPMPSELPTN